MQTCPSFRRYLIIKKKFIESLIFFLKISFQIYTRQILAKTAHQKDTRRRKKKSLKNNTYNKVNFINTVC